MSTATIRFYVASLTPSGAGQSGGYKDLVLRPMLTQDGGAGTGTNPNNFINESQSLPGAGNVIQLRVKNAQSSVFSPGNAVDAVFTGPL